MLFNSIEFLIFFPTVVLMYYAIPGKWRMYWILLTSYVFYMNWNPSYALLLLFSTAITFLFSLLIGKHRKKELAAEENGQAVRHWSKAFVGISFAINLAILFFYKYFDFTVDNINMVRGWLGLEAVTPQFDVLLPVGISFYIFQALSYVVDVYRGDVRTEKNFFKYAAFVSFFPQLVAGPIERSTNLLEQFDTPHKLEYDNVRDGLLKMIWGFFLKIVIADRAAILVNQVFNYSAYYEGPTVVVACILFAFQVYGDFAGYSNIAVGAAQVMGFRLMKNFDRPYFAYSVADFWRRWHISLSTWFRDYLYIPLGGNRKGTGRKYLNQMIVMLVSGLWHGAAWNYIVWGALNGVYQVVGGMTKPFRRRMQEKYDLRTKSASFRVGQSIITFLLIDFSWIFFRANTMQDAVHIVGSLFRGWSWQVLFDETFLHLGFTQSDWIILLVSLVVLFVVGLMQEKGISVLETVKRQQVWLRWGLYLTALFVVLLFGIYGPSFAASSFIYFQF